MLVMLVSWVKMISQPTIRITHEDYGSSGRYSASLPDVTDDAD